MTYIPNEHFTITVNVKHVTGTGDDRKHTDLINVAVSTKDGSDRAKEQAIRKAIALLNIELAPEDWRTGNAKPLET